MNVHTLQLTTSEKPTPNGLQKIRCRQIEAADIDAIVDLLTVGFPLRSRDYWRRALQLLSGRPLIEGCPRYGYMLECGGKAVGVILLLFSQPAGSDEVRCNGSSWYVAPAFRSVAVSLITRTLTHRATHTNLSPSTNVLPIFDALGYQKFCDGLFAAVPWLAASVAGMKVRRVKAASDAGDFAPADDMRLLADHANFGCVSLWCETPDEGAAFVFRRRFVKNLPAVPAAQLVHCDSIDQLVRFAGPIGRYLALHGMPFLIAPANGPIPGLVGKYFGDKPMYFRGPSPPRLGDMAYTEMAMFGV